MDLDNLVQANDNEGIDFSLMRTCRRVKYEVQGMLKVYNKITFRSFRSPILDSDPVLDVGQSCAGVVHTLVRRFELVKGWNIVRLAPELLTADIRLKVNARFPQFECVVTGLASLAGEDINNQIIFSEDALNSLGEAPSTFRILDHLYNLVSQHPSWATLSREAWTQHPHKDFVCTIDDALREPDPWTIIATQEDIHQVRQEFYPRQDWYDPYIKTAFASPSDEYAFSAAAVAIKFLTTLSTTERCRFPHIELREDDGAVVFPECHVQGLMPFLRENLRLRVQRIANL